MWGFKEFAVEAVVWSLWLTQCFDPWSWLWCVAVAVATTAVLWAMGTYRHDYWRSRGVFSPPALPFVGHIWTVVTFKEQGGMLFKRMYDEYKDYAFLACYDFYQRQRRSRAFTGIVNGVKNFFRTSTNDADICGKSNIWPRTLVVRSPALVRRVCVADFGHFVDRGFFFNKSVDPLAGSVLFLTGDEWRNLRAKITPIFSPNKLKGMLPLIEDTAEEFVIRLKRLLSVSHGAAGARAKDVAELFDSIEFDSRVGTDNTATVDSEKLVGGYTADAIVPCAFGLKSNVMDNEDDPFAVALNAFYEMSLYNIFEKTMRQFWPAFALFFRMRIIPRKTHDFFYNIVASVLRAREMGIQEKRGDFIDMMMALKSDDGNNNSDKRDDGDVEITDMVISANAFIIFLGGFETTSSTLAFLLMELAAHPDVQKKLRREVLQVLEEHNGRVSYEMLQDLAYMKMVIQETLRLYPPFPNIQRLCTKDYRIPDSDVTVEKGTIVLFPTLGIQRDPQYWERAEEFVPSRWGGASPAPGLYMPFGDGPRYCIGKRFAVIQMKMCLVKVLPMVHVSPPPSAPRRTEPFRPDPRSPLTLHPADSTLTFTYIPPEKLHVYF